MERISIDTIGPLPSDMGIKYIIVIIDTFSRYVELFPKQEVTAMAAADALWRHTCRFTAPLELFTDFGSQFVNDLLTNFPLIKHHTTLPYSKEENGIVERANQEVNRHIRNILFNLGTRQKLVTITVYHGTGTQIFCKTTTRGITKLTTIWQRILH